MESNIYCPCIVINRLHVAMSCYEAIKRLRQICRCYMAKSEFPRFADVALLRIEAEKRAAESPRSKAEVHHWKPASGESNRTLGDVCLVVEDIWYAARLSLSYMPIIDCQCVLTNHLRINCLF